MEIPSLIDATKGMHHVDAEEIALSILETCFRRIQRKGETVTEVLMSPREYSVLRSFGRYSPVDIRPNEEGTQQATLWGAAIHVPLDFGGVVLISRNNRNAYARWLPEVKDEDLVKGEELDKLKLEWFVYERSEDDPLPDTTEAFETEEADSYRNSHLVLYREPSGVSFMYLPVLRQVWGKPWNGLALNLVHSLRPSCIRVIGPGHLCSCDCYAWRVTVRLDDDDRTIDRINQEVKVGTRGCRDGHDVGLLLAGHELRSGRSCICNSAAVDRIKGIKK